MQTPLLQTERLILRPIALSDAPAVQKHFNNWNIIQNLSTAVPWPYPPDGAESFIRAELQKIADGQENYIWVLVLKDGSDEAIGAINFRRLEKGSKGNRGFWLAEPYWRLGLMTEAVKAVNDFVFVRLGPTEYYVCNSADNAGSRVKQKTGARFVCYVEIPHHSGGTRSERGWCDRPKISTSLPKEHRTIGQGQTRSCRPRDRAPRARQEHPNKQTCSVPQPLEVNGRLSRDIMLR